MNIARSNFPFVSRYEQICSVVNALRLGTELSYEDRLESYYESVSSLCIKPSLISLFNESSSFCQIPVFYGDECAEEAYQFL